jgi:polyhydroxyalkanoate synthesis repressor PhaR
MPVVKRYPNRKMYDTEAKSYITLAGIAELIRQGKEVQVIDHASGEDLTAVTLTHIIFEQEKKRGGFLPKGVLTGLVQAGGETMSTLRRTLASPLELARHVDEEIEQRLQTLISRGELAAEEGRKLSEKLLGQNRADAALADQERLEQMMDERGVPTQNDLQDILGQLDALTDKLDNLVSSEETSQTQ